MDNKVKKKYSNYKQKSTDKSKAMLVQRDQPESTSVSINLRDLNFNTVRGIKSKGELKVWNTRDLPIIHNTYSPLHKDSMNSPNEDADEKNSTIFLPNYPQNDININSKNEWSKVIQNESYNARQKSAYNFDSKKINDKTPSFSSITQNISQSNEDNEQDESNSICGLSSQTFSDSTKLIIDKELLNNIRQVSSQLLAIKDSFKKYKEYYKLEVLEQQFIILNSLLQDSFNRAFAQIVDLSVWNSEKNLDTSMNDTSNLKEYKYKYKKLKNLYKDKIQEIQDIQSIFTKERAELVNILKSKEKDLTDAFSRHTKSLNQESDSSQGTFINPIDIEIHSLKERIVKLENEREQARFYAKELEEELEQTKSVLKNNQTNLIEPLKNRLWELEQCIQNKEDKVRRNYRRKLKKWRKELENEKKINISLAKRICLINPDDRPASAFDYRNSKNERSRVIEKNQSRSIIDLNRSRQGYYQFETQINLKKVKENKTIDTYLDEECIMPIQMDSVRSIKEIDYNSVRRNKSENPIKSSTFSAYHDSLVKQIQSKNEDIKLGTEGSWDSMEHTAKFKHSLNENYYNNYSESNSKWESITSKSKKNTLQNTFNDLKAVNNHHEVLKDITNRKTNKRNKKYK